MENILETEGPVTVDVILQYFQEAIRERKPLPPSLWLDGAMKLDALLDSEDDLLAEYHQQVSSLKLAYLEEDEKHNVSAAKAKVDATDEYKKLRKQEARVKRIEEFIRLAKIQARMRDTGFGLQR